MRYKDKKKEYRVDDIAVVTTIVLHMWDKKSAPVETRVFFLATEFEGRYYELFSDEELKRVQLNEDGSTELIITEPYVYEATPLLNFVNDTDVESMSARELLRLITDLNIELGMQIMNPIYEEE